MAKSIEKINIESVIIDPEAGIKDGKNPVIFMHGMLCSKETWVEIPQAVADSTGRRVYVYDARNHGDSGHTDQSGFDLNVQDLLEFMGGVTVNDATTVAADQVILVGYDMGGLTAISAALAIPKKFEKVIVIEMYTKRVPDFLLDRSKIFMTKWTECVRKLPKGTPMELVTKISVEKLYEELEDDMKENNEKSSYQNANFLYHETAEGYDVLYNTDNLCQALDELKGQKDFKGKYEKPAYFFYGEKSHFNIGNEKDSIKELFPLAKFVEFEGGSHFFIADVPDKVASEISKSINEMS
ncbi:sn-1-specific diacylglycerol lipase ABHD11 [Parasteatoda tepidariorum]|uniref:sn-1-specific diacylglycerol lipase ABHD11 n=1 Tax=Parasteatoda tepidariorum TaxID=114398 RepID=UPI00077FDAC9|nr:protein ABHD11 [Parasteatoda tepidariorum]